MTRTWKSLALIALAVMFASARPTLADDAKNTDKADDVAKTLREMKTKLDGLDALKKSVDEINDKLTTLRDDHTRDMQNVSREVVSLKEELARLRTEVDNLRRNTTSATRQSGFAPGATATVPPTTGRVELRNTWGGTLSVVVNNRVYRVPAGPDPVLTDPIPAGTFNYEVIGITAPTNVRTLAAGETYVIHVHPRF